VNISAMLNALGANTQKNSIIMTMTNIISAHVGMLFFLPIFGIYKIRRFYSWLFCLEKSTQSMLGSVAPLSFAVKQPTEKLNQVIADAPMKKNLLCKIRRLANEISCVY